MSLTQSGLLRQFFLAVLPAICFSLIHSAYAQNFNVPSVCTNGVSGTESLYDNLPPIASVTYNGGASSVRGVVTQDTSTKNWFVTVNITNAFPTYLIVATYTPFLQSYRAGTFRTIGEFVEQLPAPGVYSNPQYHLYSFVTITVMTEDGGSTPMPGAFLELAPDFVGSSPYSIQADSEGKVILNCFTALPAGNPATVFTADHDFAYTTTYTFSPTRSNALSAIGKSKVAAKSKDKKRPEVGKQ